MGTVGPEHFGLRVQVMLEAQLQGVVILAKCRVVLLGLETTISFFLQLEH